MNYNPAYGAPNQGQVPSQLAYGAPNQHQGQVPSHPAYGAPNQHQGQVPSQPTYCGQPLYGYPGQQPQNGYPGYGGSPAIDPNVYSWFKAVDQDNSGHINAIELSRALQNGNRCNFSGEACKLMIGMFDTDYSGTINVQEFSQLFQYINKWTGVYRQFDQDNSGTIEEREMEMALQQMGYRLSSGFVSHLVSKFSPKERKMGLDHFIVANVQLHRLTEAFKKKDTQMKGMVTMTYEEFIALSLSM